jgi:hypothetical protein
MSDGDTTSTDRAPWWRKGATGLAVASLFVTLIFNAVGVWQGSRSEGQARRTEQVSLLTELNQRLTEAEAKVNATEGIELRCADPIPNKVLRKVQPPLREVLSYYEYLAWLYNSDQLKATESEEVFAARLIDGDDVAKRFLGPNEFPQLRKFSKGREVSGC